MYTSCNWFTATTKCCRDAFVAMASGDGEKVSHYLQYPLIILCNSTDINYLLNT